MSEVPREWRLWVGSARSRLTATGQLRRFPLTPDHRCGVTGGTEGGRASPGTDHVARDDPWPDTRGHAAVLNGADVREVTMPIWEVSIAEEETVVRTYKLPGSIAIEKVVDALRLLAAKSLTFDEIVGCVWSERYGRLELLDVQRHDEG